MKPLLYLALMYAPLYLFYRWHLAAEFWATFFINNLALGGWLHALLIRWLNKPRP